MMNVWHVVKTMFYTLRITELMSLAGFLFLDRLFLSTAIRAHPPSQSGSKACREVPLAPLFLHSL